MTKEEIINKVIDKVHNEYLDYFDELKKLDKEEIINKAYEIAHYNEVDDFFCNIDTEYPPFDIFIFENMLKYDGRIIEKVWEGWLDYSHPERFNFFCYEDLTDIVLWEFKN